MTIESPIPACPRCARPTAGPWGDSVFCSACRRWFRPAASGAIESTGTGLPLDWQPEGGTDAN